MAKEIVVTLANGDKAGETLKQLTHQAAALKKEISNLKPGTEEFVKASASLNQVKDRMTDIDKQVKSTTSASDALKKAWNTLPGASFFNQIGDSFSLAK
jgi:phage shock protein A